jgi:hypothetical protein
MKRTQRGVRFAACHEFVWFGPHLPHTNRNHPLNVRNAKKGRRSRMSEVAHITRNVAQQQEPRRTKLQEVLGAIPPANHEREIAEALEFDRERRAEIKSKLEELATDELERILRMTVGPVR